MTIKLYELCGADEKRPFSPHCWKTVMSLAHKGLEFETSGTPFTEIGKVEGGVSRTVPIIRDGDKVVADSFAIAEYLDETYPDHPSLFKGEGGKSVSRFIEAWSQMTIHPFAGSVALMDIHDMLAPLDQTYFRESREKVFGKKLEEVPVGREQRRDDFMKKLRPLTTMLGKQPFFGGKGPLFADYIVFGAFQWLRVTTEFAVLPEGDPVTEWFERCLDLHDGIGRQTPARAA